MKKTARTLPECKYHNSPFVPEWTRSERCGCKACVQSSIDIRKSEDISNAHQAGKYCRQWTQCRYCSQIKFYVRVLRHFYGCECTNKCVVCNWESKTQERYENKLEDVLIKLCKLLLHKR
jgi:hypothetical protein